MPSLDMTTPDVLEFQPSLVLLLSDAFTGGSRLEGGVTVKAGKSDPLFQKYPDSTFIFVNLANGSYSVQVRSTPDQPYYSPIDIPVKLPSPRPAKTLWPQPPVWNGYPDLALADPNKTLDDPDQTAAYVAQRRLAALQPTTAYPFPAGATLVRGVVTGAGTKLNGALVTTSLMAQPGQFPVVVVNLDGTISFAQNLAVVSTPVIESIDPPTAIAGGPDFILSLEGSGFNSGAVVKLNGAPLPATVLSANAITAQVTAAQVGNVGPLAIIAANPDGTTSNQLMLNVAQAPAADAIDPETVTAGSAAFTLTVFGAGFAPGSGVELNGSALLTTFVTSSELTAQVPAAGVANPGQFSVVVANPGPPLETSNSQILAVLSASAVPVITSIVPTTITADSATFTLIARGSGFVPGSLVELNSVALTTTFVSSTQLDAHVPRSGYTTGQDGTFVLFFDDVRGRSQTVTLIVTHPQFAKPRLVDVTVLRGATVSVPIDMSA